MNYQDFRNLQEAYLSVYAPQELDELSVNKMLAYVKKGEKNREDLNKKWDKGTATHRERMRVLGREEGEARAYKKIEKKTGKRPYEMNALDKARYAVTKEDYVDEGAAGDVAARAEKLAAQRKGQTPKADAAYTALAFGKGVNSKTKAGALKHLIRSASHRYNSDKPSPHRSNMTQSDRDYHRGQSENGGKDREGIDFDEFDTGASGPGGKPKGKKLERQIKRGISAESYDLYDIILSHLLDEGYADTQEAAEAIMVNMSEEWRDDISELYKGKHGQSETEYQAGRSDAGKRVSGDENTGPRHYALGRSARPDAPTKPGEKPKNTPKLANWEKDDIQYRKANLKK
jgi:hypothetical protein